MKRFVSSIAGPYLLAALMTRAAEAAGIRECGCDDECWCKRPGLSAFRWVFPRGHRSNR